MSAPRPGDHEILSEYLYASGVVLDRRFAQDLNLATMGTRITALPSILGGSNFNVTVDLPDEEDLRSVAAALRPIMIGQDEPVAMGKVLNSLGRSIVNESIREPLIKPIKAAWKSFVKDEYFRMATWEEGYEGPLEYIRDREMAVLWLYSELLHFNPQKRQRLQSFGRTAALQAAALWAKDSCMFVRAVRGVIIDLRTAGELAAS